MSEQLINWEPIQDGEVKVTNYALNSIIDDMDKFAVFLSSINDPAKRIYILFDHSVQAYRVTPRKYDAETISMLKKQWGPRFDEEQVFFKPQKSSYIQWMMDESYNAWNPDHITHFAFIASDFVIDVASNYEPQISIIYTRSEPGE